MIRPTVQRARPAGAAIVLALIATLPGSLAGSEWVTAADLTDAILERRAFDPQQLLDLDLNGDGLVDVADLICLEYDCHREAGFDGSRTTVSEGAGTINLRIALALPVDATLTYTVGGSATAGVDYSALSGQVSVNGTVADIPLSIVDDAQLDEPIEIVELRLQSGAGYGLGADVLHRVYIVDNDASWYGALYSRAGAVRFRLDVEHTDAGYAAHVVGETGGTFPVGQYPATVDIQPGVRFEVDAPGIESPAGATAFGATIRRRLQLNPADLVGDGSGIQLGDAHVLGQARQTLEVVGRPELSRTDEGTFSLVRRNGDAAAALAALEGAGQ